VCIGVCEFGVLWSINGGKAKVFLKEKLKHPSFREKKNGEFLKSLCYHTGLGIVKGQSLQFMSANGWI
jgi:hypothetical protein